MKKTFNLILSCLFLLFLLVPFSSCKEDFFLLNSVCYYKSDLFTAVNDQTKFTAILEKTETPLNLNGEVSSPIVNRIVISFSSIEKEKAYSITVNLDKQLTANFTFSDATSKYIAVIETENLPKNEFTADLYLGSESINLKFISNLPSDTIDLVTTLKSLYSKQKTLIDENTQNGVYRGEIFVKVSVINEKAYYYIALITSEQKIAFLIDGKSGELLATKDLPRK